MFYGYQVSSERLDSKTKLSDLMFSYWWLFKLLPSGMWHRERSRQLPKVEAVRFSEASVGSPSDKLRAVAPKKVLMSTLLNSLKSLKCQLLPFTQQYTYFRGARWCSWLRHCATSRRVEGSIPDGITGIFRWTQFFRPHYGAGVDTAS